ncbi:MAG: VOC family protein [Pseudomonadota bacterium]
MRPTPYLFFDGACFEAMSFYAEVLGGEVIFVMRNGDARRPEDRMPGPDDAVMNMAIKIDGSVMMGSDMPAGQEERPQGFRLQLEASSRDEFDRVHDALGAEARAVAMPAGETFWAEHFAMFTDRFGTPWMLNFAGSKGSG